MNNKRGFSLVELLAVIVILGILLGTGIIVTTRLIDNSRKEIYLAAVKTQVEGVKLLIESEEYDVYDENTTYYFDYNILKETDDIKSPYAEWDKAYVVVTYTNDKLKYYWTGIDTAGWRIDLGKEVDKLTKKDIYNKKGNLLIGNSLGGKDLISITSVDDGEEQTSINNPTNHMTKQEADRCFEYELKEDNTCRITNYKNDQEGCGPDVNMPSSIDGQIVTSIGRGAFRSKGIKSVILYDGVEEIELGAFQNNSITQLKLSKTLKTIGAYAFYQNKIPEVSFPEGLDSIGEYGFATNKLTKVILPESLRVIGAYAFYNNLLKDITFNSNPSIGGGAFSNNKMPSSEGILYKYDATMRQFDYSTIIGYCSDSKTLVIPSEVNGVQPKRINANAFASAGLTSVDMPDSIEYIGGDAFAFNSITTLKISNNVKTIASGAFRANQISSVTIPDTVTSMGGYVFNTNKMTGEDGILYARKSDGTIDYTTIIGYGGGRIKGPITIPAKKEGVTLEKITSSAFIDSNLTSITLPDLSETPHLTISNNVFCRNSVSGEAGFIYKIKDGKIDYSTLSSYAGPTGGVGSDKVITIPQSKNGVDLLKIEAAFSWMSYRKIIVPETVTSISSGAFSHSNRNNIYLKTIVNKSPNKFDWYAITGSSITPKPANFEYGTIEHQSGNIEVVKG